MVAPRASSDSTSALLRLLPSVRIVEIRPGALFPPAGRGIAPHMGHGPHWSDPGPLHREYLSREVPDGDGT
jgi:hypothetical protein